MYCFLTVYTLNYILQSEYTLNQGWLSVLPAEDSKTAAWLLYNMIHLKVNLNIIKSIC